MNRKYLTIAVLGVLLFSFTAFYAQKMYEGKVSIIARSIANNLLAVATSTSPATEEVKTEPAVEEKVPLSSINSRCNFAEPAIPIYEGEFLGVHTPATVSKGEIFKTVVSFKNTGNIPWFSIDANCSQAPIINLGTSHPLDRSSMFMAQSPEFTTYWVAPNRIKMKSQRVEPGDIAYFEFWSQAPDQDDIFIEYFTPVVEGIKWIDTAAAKITIRTGEFDPTIESKSPFAIRSRGLKDFNISEEKNIIIDVSDQIMHLRVGEDVMYTFPVSTGAYSTPTPYGTTKIQFKQEVRVGGKWPHYVMPKFMWFRAGGYGIHALPSLRNDGGTFWREARNHIQRRVSHGCVRLLPEDADVAYDFSEPGTPVTVQP